MVNCFKEKVIKSPVNRGKFLLNFCVTVINFSSGFDILRIFLTFFDLGRRHLKRTQQLTWPHTPQMARNHNERFTSSACSHYGHKFILGDMNTFL